MVATCLLSIGVSSVYVFFEEYMDMKKADM
jgi:hypothetical protein